jgi:hypothetical protein
LSTGESQNCGYRGDRQDKEKKPRAESMMLIICGREIGIKNNQKSWERQKQIPGCTS